MTSEIDAAIKAVDVGSLVSRLPKSPRVQDILLEGYRDHMGELSLRVVVVLDEKTKDADRQWVKLEPIDRIVRDTLSEVGVTLYPYVRFFKRSELRKGAVA